MYSQNSYKYRANNVADVIMADIVELVICN